MIKRCAKTDTLRLVNGWRGKVAAKERNVTICMLLLLVMMGNKIKLANSSHVLDAKAVLMIVHVLYDMKQSVLVSICV